LTAYSKRYIIRLIEFISSLKEVNWQWQRKRRRRNSW